MQRILCQNKKVLTFSSKKKEKNFSEKIRGSNISVQKNKQK